MPETEPHYLTYEKWPAWAKNIHRLTLDAEAKEGPVKVGIEIRPLYDEVKRAIAEDRVPRKAIDVLKEADHARD